MYPARKSIIVALAMTLALAGDVTAQTNWLEQASSLLKGQAGTATSTQPAAGELGEAFKQALQIGSGVVVNQLGQTDGFNKDPAIRIPLPQQLNTAKSMLGKIGMSSVVEDLELRLNRAAEAATPKAKELFLQSITQMSFADVMAIYAGPPDSATRYFQEKMTPSLISSMRPIVDGSLSEVGAIQSYDRFIGAYKKIPFVPDIRASLTDHVVNKCIEGIFYYLAKEEAAIRADPARQTTALLKKVFGGNR